jgi:hypothetical protein
MEKTNVSIIYGLPIGPLIGYSEAREIFFPHCDDEIIGGCVITEGQATENEKYVCNKCNIDREKWKKLHRSELVFDTSIEIKEKIALVLNYEVLEIDKENIIENNYINCISLPNGIYDIFVKNMDTNENKASMEIKLKNECASVLVFINNENNISIKVNYKHETYALWY